jgi:ribose transport system substrate-binding protein
MKHPLIRRIAATATAGLVVALAACAAAPTEPAPSAPAPAEAETTSVEYSIGVLVPQENQNAYGASYVDNLRKKAEALGVTITLLNSDYTATTQQAQMDQLIAQGVDGIILWPAVFGTTSTMLLAAQEAGIPVNISNSVVSDEEVDLFNTFTGPSDVRIGSDQADIVNDLLGGQGNIVVIEGQPGNTAAIGRLNGLTDRLAEVAPGITILGSQPANWLQAMAQTATSNLLTRFGDQVDVVVAADDVMAAGAAAAIKNSGLSGISLVGSGYYEVTPALIESGEQFATLFQSPCWDAVYALEKMVDVLNGVAVDKEYLMPVPVVTKDTMADFTPMGCLPGTEF